MSIQTITHTASGAKSDVLDYGATILSYKPSGNDDSDCFFVSRDAKKDASKAVRGGIPLVFPIFGPPPSEYEDKMPQHGFARNNTWKVVEGSLYDNDTSAGLSFSLSTTESGMIVNGRGDKKWSETSDANHACELKFTIDLNATQMTTTLEITNTGKTEFPLQTLFHTYYKVQGHATFDNAQCYVEGLKGYSKIDKVKNGETSTCEEDRVTLNGFTDSVYNPTADDKQDVNVTIGVGGSKTVSLSASGIVNDKKVPVSCVVWNPGKDNAEGMSDFGSDQYVDMICVEPGILLNRPTLPSGKIATLKQTITVG